MYKFSDTSKKRLSTCDKRLQDICNEAIKQIDFTIVCGYRGEKEQKEAVANRKSRLDYPFSKHNKQPSLAVDIIPYFDEEPHLRWEKGMKSIYELHKIMISISESMRIALRWGGDFKTFKDYPHYELI